MSPELSNRLFACKSCRTLPGTQARYCPEHSVEIADEALAQYEAAVLATGRARLAFELAKEELSEAEHLEQLAREELLCWRRK